MVMKDEARHVAFGVLSLRDFYCNEINEKERREREEFTYEACRLMRDRFIGTEIFENIGFPVAECDEMALHGRRCRVPPPALHAHRAQHQAARACCRRSCADGFTELGILQFEDMPPTASGL
jgi:hypothetical protein